MYIKCFTCKYISSYLTEITKCFIRYFYRIDFLVNEGFRTTRPVVLICFFSYNSSAFSVAHWIAGCDLQLISLAWKNAYIRKTKAVLLLILHFTYKVHYLSTKFIFIIEFFNDVEFGYMILMILFTS